MARSNRRPGTPLDDPRLQTCPAGRLIGIPDIAIMFDVKRDTVDLWSERDKSGRSQAAPMPEPLLPKVGDTLQTPLWDRDEIIQWGEVTGRAERARQNRRAAAIR